MTKEHTAQSQPDGLSRRRFLEVGACLAGGHILSGKLAHASEPRLTIPPGAAAPRVVKVRSEYVVAGPSIHPQIALEMLEESLTALTDKPSLQSAWQSILTPNDVVGLKFNQSGQAGLGTTDVLAPIIVRSLLDAGFGSDRIVCIEAPSAIAAEFQTAKPWPGYDHEEVSFASGKDQLARVLNQVTALISVPFLKTHNLAGMTCTLKNLSHAFVKHPARYHNGGCAPFIADICSLPQIREKLRLCLVDAFRVVYRDGPEARDDRVRDAGIMLASFDPVAADTIGLGVLNELRRDTQLGAIAETPGRLRYLADAHRKGLGIAVPTGIELIHRDLS